MIINGTDPNDDILVWPPDTSAEGWHWVAEDPENIMPIIAEWEPFEYHYTGDVKSGGWVRNGLGELLPRVYIGPVLSHAEELTLRASVSRLEDQLAQTKRRVERQAQHILNLRAALQWMVDNDETNQGDWPLEEHGGLTWNELNGYWIDGLNRAKAALEEENGDDQ